MKMPKSALYDARFKDMNAEQVYAIILKESKNGQDMSNFQGSLIDNHDIWDSSEAQEDAQDKERTWTSRVLTASEKAPAGSLPAGLESYIKTIREPKLDWRELIHTTISCNPMDYDFTRRDLRFMGDIILPAFCDPDTEVEDVIYMKDTSGSMGEEDDIAIYSEIVGAIEQFNGKIKGHIGFFDATVYPIKPFESVDDVLNIPQVGGGGTSFKAVLDYVAELEKTRKVNTVIIATDGYCKYPEENPVKAPLVWLMTTDEVAPYGQTAQVNSNGQR